MRLTSLEIKGFKSFGDKVTIHFDKGVTSIVGPNGSGKSNLLEALAARTDHARLAAFLRDPGQHRPGVPHVRLTAREAEALAAVRGRWGMRAGARRVRN